ncbi:hypothetical protein D9757_013429 [Collybiopsis confluens]|uniref:Uncharacterized protein n=1 Tax=Collybiopsis confluens TaxID=2823264 RepID=A0A8H5FPG9_9AGAR|nr:hypothetical protein D9757_013429 [Collybiopsis confluens]
MPSQVELPEDIHPLPDSVTAYFVYPFTLEPQVLTMESSRRSTIAAHEARRQAYLRSREDEKEQRKREALRKIAPGFEPRGSLLVPTRASSVPLSTGSESADTGPGPITSSSSSGTPGHRHSKSVMEDLVDQLAALDSNVQPR